LEHGPTNPEWNIDLRLIELYQKARENESSQLRRLKVRFWVIAFFLLAVVLFRPLLGIDFVAPILLLSSLGLVSNLISLLWIMWGKGLKYNTYFATFVDALLITIAVHYLGGIESTFSWVYVIALVAVASLHGIGIAIYIATVCSLLFTGLLLLEFWKIIPHVDFHRINPVYLYEDSSYLYTKLLSNYILFFITAGVAGVLSQRMIRSKEELERTVVERTKELATANEQLSQDITERKRGEAALKKSFSLITATLESTADGIMVVDTAGNIQKYNQRFLEVWRLSEDFVKSNDDMQIRLHMLNQIKDPDRVIKETEELYDHQEIDNHSVMELEDGRIVERYSRPQKVEGETVGRVISFRDITERRRAEEAIRASEANYRAIFDSANDAIFIHDIETGEIRDFNQRACEMFGYTRDEMRMLDVNGLSTGESPHTQQDALRLIDRASKGEPQLVEWKAKHKSGRVFWAEVSIKSAVIGGNDCMLAILREINERKLAEEALRENKQRLSNTLNAVPDMVYELALDGTVLYANDIASETLGIPLETLGEITLLDLLDEESLQTASKEIQRILETGEPSHNVKYNLKACDGQIIPVEAHAVVLERKNQEPTILGVARDITEKKLLEQQLLQAQKMESIGTLAGGIAHDFNNILGGILGYASFMKSKIETDHPFFKYLDTIERSSTRAAELTAQLLGFARGGKYDTKPLNLNEAVIETLDIIERTIDKSISIETQMSESLPTITADGGQLQQVLMNLFINAADSMPAGGRLTIETDTEILSEEYARLHMGAKSGSYVRLAVTDTGIGMDKETQKRIFEPFFTTKKEGKGTGLGLSMVYGVVKNHEGYIAVYSELGHGTTFKIYLPVSGEAESARTPEAPAPHGRGELILVVDDEEPIRDFTKDVLEGNGYRVILAEDGVQAVRICEEYDGNISLVVLDMVMPKMGGHETFLRMRASNPKIRALLSTGYSQNSEAQAILDSGVKGFIQKPYQPNALLSKVRSVIDVDG
jgi:PAS domain S-box-containing protein